MKTTSTAATPGMPEPGAGTSQDEMPECDLVMKGGVTSGVVYPRLIFELSAKYRFRNIGGTSAGAIAAAACAAAEHGRLSKKNAHGFDELGKLADRLSERVGDRRHSMLFHLFQPAAAVGRHFAVLVSVLNAPPLAAAGRALLAMLRQFWGTALLGLALALVLFTPVVMMTMPAASIAHGLRTALFVLLMWWLWAAFGLRHAARLQRSPWLVSAIWWAVGLALTAMLLLAVSDDRSRLWLATLAGGIAAPLTIGLALALSGMQFVITLVRGLHGNGYGLCSGRTMDRDPGAPKGLTDWLGEYLNALAGLKDKRPLTFGDLWGASFDGTRFLELPAGRRRINLEVMTAAVSQQLCYAIPFRGGQSLYYDPKEWARLFPESVMQWIDAVSAAETGAAAAEDPRSVRRVVHKVGNVERPLSRLPGSVNLPVVVAVRLSLCFPFLLSAVPLYAVDFSREFNQAAEPGKGAPAAGVSAAAEPSVLRATRVWFSDGGIASNMPLHFFDAPLPGHPTFAVDLEDEHPDFPIKRDRKAAEQKGRVYLPSDNRGGRLRYWPEPGDGSAWSGLAGFLAGIVKTMQNWRDELQFPYPGYRDRIVQVKLLKDEGGLNLDMPKENVGRLSDAGEYAAQRLIERFHPPESPVSEGWKNHREVRLRTFLGVLEQLAVGLQPRLAEGDWDRVIDGLVPGDYTQAHARLARECLERLSELGVLLKDSAVSLEKEAPRPRASMRIAPRI